MSKYPWLLPRLKRFAIMVAIIFLHAVARHTSGFIGSTWISDYSVKIHALYSCLRFNLHNTKTLYCYQKYRFFFFVFVLFCRFRMQSRENISNIFAPPFEHLLVINLWGPFYFLIIMLIVYWTFISSLGKCCTIHPRPAAPPNLCDRGYGSGWSHY